MFQVIWRVLLGLALLGVGLWSVFSEDSGVYWWGAVIVGPMFIYDGIKHWGKRNG